MNSVGSNEVVSGLRCNEGNDATMTAGMGVLASMAKVNTQCKAKAHDLNGTNFAPRKNNDSNNGIHDCTISSKQQQSYISFLKEISKRIPKPLSTLVKIIPAHQNKLVRRSGCFLCRSVLMITTYVFPVIPMVIPTPMTTENLLSSSMMVISGIQQQDREEGKKEDEVIETGMERTAMECCLALTEDDDREF
eukprot:11779530-Ditylum_brightwellii.AAC.1